MNIDDILFKLSKSKFRSSFHLKQKDLDYIEKKGLKTIESHAYDFIRTRLAPENPLNDGKQTPTHGHPVFVSEHATATCCRECLYKWHHIRKNHELSEEEIDYVIVNGAECEPYLTSDYRLMLERPEDLIQGLHVVLSLFDNAKGVIAIEDNKPEAIAKLQYLTDSDPDIEVKVLKTKYPQGAERQVIYVTTGRKINSKMLPADAGCIVDNVQTVLAIYDAVCKTTPSMSRVVTLTGDAMAEPQNYKVKFGMSHAELLEEAGGLKENAKKLISGGPMMGMAMYDLNTPITKTSSSILAMSEDEVEKFEPTNCIRCGRCATVCPSHLVPQMMAQAAERNDLDYFQKLNGMECYECGTCTFVCPAKRRLTQIFKQARRAVMDQNRKK